MTGYCNKGNNLYLLMPHTLLRHAIDSLPYYQARRPVTHKLRHDRLQRIVSGCLYF